jgi:putative N-acetyltransferase (TIGR04045 family)
MSESTSLRSPTTRRVARTPLDFLPGEFRIQWADGAWMNEEVKSVRHEVFCAEQGLFGGPEGNDEDEIDRKNSTTKLIAALSCCCGHPTEVLGTVRIHAAAPGIWWGSRLAIRRPWRGQAQLGPGLIRLAVCSANALGCTEFLAHVQAPNVTLFERLHWEVLDRIELHGRPHALMRADLEHYPPCFTPRQGFVLVAGGQQ